MRVLIVSKTHMRDMACVGGLTLDENKNARLLQANGLNQPQNTPYEVGDIWDLNLEPKLDIVPPHIEDVLVHSGKHVGRQDNMRSYLLGSVRHWQGSPEQFFDGLIRFTWNGAGYISRRNNLPKASVGFWLPPSDLERFNQQGKVRYRFLRAGKEVWLPYVGFEPAVQLLPQGTLVRLSLARWWRKTPDMEERCYVQLSGWYGTADTAPPIRAEEEYFGDDEMEIPF